MAFHPTPNSMKIGDGIASSNGVTYIVKTLDGGAFEAEPSNEWDRRHHYDLTGSVEDYEMGRYGGYRYKSRRYRPSPDGMPR